MTDEHTPDPGENAPSDDEAAESPTPDVPDSEDASDSSSAADPSAPQSQEIKHSQVSALVPEAVARGVFSTGAVVLQGAHEFILDFLIRMQQPQQVAARVVLPHSVVPQFLAALRENIRKYEERFGQIPNPAAQQQQPQGERASAQELYEQLKLHEDVMSGSYANAVMIGHSAYEFSFDFITTFFPRSSVAARVFLSAPNVPRLLDSLTHSFNQFQQQRNQQNPPENPFGTGTFGDG